MAEEQERRMKRFPVSSEVLTTLLAGVSQDSQYIHSCWFKDLPSDAQFVTARWEAERNCFVCVYYHDSFDIVEEGSEIPVSIGAECTIFENKEYRVR